MTFSPSSATPSTFVLRRCRIGTASLTAKSWVLEPPTRLSYSWNASGEEAATGLKTVVTWTLSPTQGGTLVRMEQSGFRPEEEANYQGANYGWQRNLEALERLVERLN